MAAAIRRWRAPLRECRGLGQVGLAFDAQWSVPVPLGQVSGLVRPIRFGTLVPKYSGAGSDWSTCSKIFR